MMPAITAWKNVLQRATRSRIALLRAGVLLLAALAALLQPWTPVLAAPAELRSVQLRGIGDAAWQETEVVVEISRAVSFDAGVQAAPLRLEMLIPAAGLAKGWRVPEGGGLIGEVHQRRVSGGVLLSFALRHPALIVDAHAERATGDRPARLVVRLARTDTATLARMLGVDEAVLNRTESPTGQSSAQIVAEKRSPGALQRIKAAYRKLIEETAAQPAGIGELIKALPLGYEGHDDERDDEQVAAAAARPAARQQDEPPAGERQAISPRPSVAISNGAGSNGAGARPVIVVDAGHGGIDPGAIGVGGVKEKTIVLAFAKVLRRELQRRGYRVGMTREGDTRLKLTERVAVARRHHAAMFISIHADRFRSQRAGGLGIFTLSEKASDADAAALARMENAADLIGAPEDDIKDGAVRDILVELAQRETNANSHLLAQRLAQSLRSVTRLRRNPVRSAAFRVLRAPEIPSLLVELGFITNPRDVRNLLSPDWRRKVAARMAEAIDKVLKARLALR